MVNETDSFLAPVALKIYTRPRRMLWSFKPFSKLGTAHIFSRHIWLSRIRKTFLVVFTWITWMTIYPSDWCYFWIYICKSLNESSL
ncbi:hypothetical protein ACROYT_G001602 [Oculina patagonica]